MKKEVEDAIKYLDNCYFSDSKLRNSVKTVCDYARSAEIPEVEPEKHFKPKRMKGEVKADE